AIVFAIADGEIPSNEGSGYVIRRILRRAVRYGYSFLNFSQPFLFDMVPLLAEQYASVFEEVQQQQAFIQQLIQAEEVGFLKTLDKGINLFESYTKTNPELKEVEGDFAFRLKDTYGFPIDLTEVMAKEKGLTVNMDRYQELLEVQKTQSKKERKTGDWIVVHDSLDLPPFKGYDTLELSTRMLQYRTVAIIEPGKGKKKKQKPQEREILELVLAETPFYAESGGQVGDRGTLTNGQETIQVLTTRKENQLIVHQVDRLPDSAEGDWQAIVDADFRRKVRANHSATHLLHAALRQFLGDHVEQRGSLVTDQALRFDFSHFEKVSPEVLSQIEDLVNAKIAAGIPLTEYRNIPIEEAKAMGAMALFGEKYGDLVRTIVFDPEFSVELCGGTHVQNTQEIRLFKLASESSISAGVRRIEAYTSDRAIAYLSDKAERLDRVAAQLKHPADVEKAVEEMTTHLRSLEKQLEGLKAEKLVQVRDQLLQTAETKGEIQLIRAKVDLGTSDDLKQLSFELRKHTSQTLIVLGAVVNTKPLLSIIQSEDLAENNQYHAGNMVRTLAKEIQGGGGGQPFYATAGGRNAAGLDQALQAVDALL
ncbi:MAG: alanine--tRNA ligase, partial [Bacteroidota bacterium]